MELLVFTTLAQHEYKFISSRTNAALREKKRKGVKLGNPGTLDEAGREAGRMAGKKNARENKENIKATQVIMRLRKKGFSFQKIANHLNSNNYKPRGRWKTLEKNNDIRVVYVQGKFFPSTVKRLYDRAIKEQIK